MPNYFRLWAPVAADTYEEPRISMRGVSARMAQVRDATRALQRRLRAGEAPPVVLVGPERGVRVDVDRAGWIAQRVFAWKYDDLSGVAGLDSHVIAQDLVVGSVITANTVNPDPFANYAAMGSVLLERARLMQLRLPSWLEPAARQIADSYGAVGAILPPRTVIKPAPPVVFKQGLTATEVADLLGRFDNAAQDGLEGKQMSNAVPESMYYKLLDLAQRAGEELGGIPVRTCVATMLRYPPGTEHAWHIDAAGRHPGAADRSVSYSLLLSEQGADFTGGDLCIWQQDTPKLGCGDMVAFTAKTRHRVSPVRTGERTALICFGSQ